MSALDSPLPPAADEALAAVPSPGRMARFESWLERASEWFNPLLVKECRQALKSRQFLVSFSLLLACAWFWSIVGIVLIGSSAYYAPAGPEMFFGYFCVLAFALLVIVPYGTFRSLAGECEDRTFELVSITTLRPRQIVSGKLGSAVAQMILYLSAVAPCLAFTYVLRGIDLLAIGFTLGYLVAASFCFSAIALLLATVAREKHWQIMLGIGIMILLLYSFALGCVAAQELLAGNYLSVNDPEFWIAHAACLTAYVSYVVLFCVAAAAQLSFASANRSTPLRITMLAQFLLWTGWMAAIGLQEADRMKANPRMLHELITAYIVVAGVHWYVMGAMMVCEEPRLSQRVKRSLPQSFLGRVLLTWFNPGPSTGYLFAVANFSAAVIIALAALRWLESQGMFNDPNPIYTPTPVPSADWLTAFLVLGLSYLVLYLGLARLVLRWLPRRPMGTLGALAGPGLQMVLLALGAGVPLMLMISSGGNHGLEYPLSQLTNPFWTLSEALADHRRLVNFELAEVLVPAMALVVFALNLAAASREVREVRIATPQRLLEDDAAPPT